MVEKASWPNYWVSKDPRVPSITLAPGIDNIFEFVSRGAGSADVIPGHEDSPDLYPVLSPIQLGYVLIWAGESMLSLTQPDSGLN